MEPFYTKGGKEVKTLNEMADVLESMPQDEFQHHVSPQRNDIAIWVEDVHHNEELAKALNQAKDKETMIKLLKNVSVASFPNTEEYHQTYGVGKEDPDLHETYNKPEEWQAAKEAAHPDEEVTNPATGQTNIEKIANEQNNEQNQELQQKEIPKPEPASFDSQPTKTEIGPETKNQIPHDLNPGEHSLKDKLIFGIVGLIIGLIIGYGIAWLLR